MKLKTTIGLASMLGFTALLFLNFGEQVGGYMNFAEAKDAGTQVHVVGQWMSERPTNYDRRRNVFTFHMRDQAGTVHKVRYSNPKPANFEEADQLVVEGRLEGDVFKARHILVKCPSKYNDGRDLKAKKSPSS